MHASISFIQSTPSASEECIHGPLLQELLNEKFNSLFVLEFSSEHINNIILHIIQYILLHNCFFKSILMHIVFCTDFASMFLFFK